MFSINPLENLKLYISSRPPLVVFMISVSAMAIAFLTLGYFFKIKEIKSPEMAEDWNTFLLRFNDLDLCVSENETLKHLSNDTTTPESTMTIGQTRSSTQPPQSLEESGPINISVAITLTLDPLKPFGGYSRNVTHLYSTILGHQIGLSGVCQLLSFQSSEAAAEIGSMFCCVSLSLLLRIGRHEVKKDWLLCVSLSRVFRYHMHSLFLKACQSG